MTVGSSTGSSAAHGSTSASGSRSSGSTQPVSPPSSDTSTAPSAASAARTEPFVAPSHHTMSSSVPGPNERSQRPTSSAYPSSSLAAGGTSPSQSDISVHRGLES